MAQSNYQLIITIVNSGYSDDVMDAARECGAPGGTIVSGRGTARQEAEKAFNILIHPEKDIIFILTTSDKTETILHAIYQKVNLDTLGQGISFACPVDQVVGMSNKTIKDLIKKEEVKKENTKTEEIKEEKK
jgi:nitrogen regulatory protein PII